MYACNLLSHELRNTIVTSKCSAVGSASKDPQTQPRYSSFTAMNVFTRTAPKKGWLRLCLSSAFMLVTIGQARTLSFVPT